ncbi:MAG: DUF3108 domain-containing protein [Ignavibacteriales bacterium]|nr:DUF3108 domain-containing protein [Ignavibacteriales bacterium]
MKIFKSIISKLFYFSICSLPLFAGNNNSKLFSQTQTFPDSVFHVSEELVYNVSYASIDIGQVRVKQLEEINKDGNKLFKSIAYIDSYKGIPFVDLHAVFQSLTHSNGYTTWFSARDKQDEAWKSTIYNFDYHNRSMYIEESIWKSDKVDKRDTVKIDTLYQDGLSLFFCARKHLFDQRRVNIPVVVNEKKFTTSINFTGQRTKEEIDAVDYPVDLIYFEGETGFVGIFGLTGGFEGWFSNDNARVPVIAKMKAIIGKIRIELMSWTRTGWAPPRAPAD